MVQFQIGGLKIRKEGGRGRDRLAAEPASPVLD
jgi:hypothetical protein